MAYFKPPGARGQALHQDNFFLRARPGTCIAAWLAIDPCDDANGCMRVVPGSHSWDLLCPRAADPALSFTEPEVPVPPGYEPVPVHMDPGDVLFFHGALVHGSLPNTTAHRFRRSLVAHYIDGRAQAVNEFNQPVLRMDGTPLWLEFSPGGRPCGVWVERDGDAVIEVSAAAAAAVNVHY
jgi:ectoine hydroxylase-related dioxygenase (phytanoyl-CoA dioxygenase family)